MKPSEAAKEYLRRQAAREGLIDFTRYTFAKYRPADHHYMIAEKLEAVERGDLKRLMIFCPPRHGKSELASKRFQAWSLGRNRDRQFISASYNSELAWDFGREVRNIILGQDYQVLFPGVEIAKDSSAANRWHTNGHGGYVAAGVDTAVTGRGAHIFTIDDPVKDRLSADNETQQIKTYNWYTSTAYTRLESDIEDDDEPDWLWDVSGALKDGLIKPFTGAIILIQTRWNENDLSGKLLDDMAHGADQWDILELPAINEKTQFALWEKKYPKKRLLKIKKAIGPRNWSALYQQKPQPDEGTYFLRKWFNRYILDEDPEKTQLPSPVNVWMTSDYAVSEDKGDFTEHSVWGIDVLNNIYLMDNWHGKTKPNVWIDEGLRLVRKYKPYVWFGEGGVIRRSTEPFLKKAMTDQNTYCRLEWINPIGDKPARGRSFQARASMGKVYLPLNDVGDRALEQMVRFPAGKDDDFVDTASLMGLVIADAHQAYITPGTPEIDYLRQPRFKDIVKKAGKDRSAREKKW